MTTPETHTAKIVDVDPGVVSNEPALSEVSGPYSDDGWNAALGAPELAEAQAADLAAQREKSLDNNVTQAADVNSVAATSDGIATEAELTMASEGAVTTAPLQEVEVPVASASAETEIVEAVRPRLVSEAYQISTATITGRAHLGYDDVVVGVNNQDSLFAQLRDDYGIVVVCDGCSHSKHSEVGAKIMTRLFVDAFQQNQHLGIPHQILEFVEAQVTRELRSIIDSMILEGETRDDVIRDYFQCTVIGAYISTAGVTFWGMGDGVYGYDSHLRYIEPAKGNYPAYFAYKLCKTFPPNIAQHGLEIYDQVMHHPASILIGSDGVKDLIALSDKDFPGTKEHIGKIERLWNQEKYWTNPEELPRELRRIQQIRKTSDLKTVEDQRLGVKRVVTELTEQIDGGYLPDDTTLAILRLLPEKEEVKSVRKGIFDRGPMSEPGRRTVGTQQLEKPEASTTITPAAAEAKSSGSDTSTSVVAPTEAGSEKIGFFKRIGLAIKRGFGWIGNLFRRKGKDDSQPPSTSAPTVSSTAGDEATTAQSEPAAEGNVAADLSNEKITPPTEVDKTAVDTSKEEIKPHE